MKILLLINWHIEYGDVPNENMLESDYCWNDRFWFFKYFHDEVHVDVVDTRSIDIIENFEKNKLRIYIAQSMRILPNLKEYDLVISHGTTSGIFLAFLHRLLKFDMPPHIVVDISSFHKGSTKGIILKLCQYASKSIDYLIYHTSRQKTYFDTYFPWLTNKSKFIPFGVDLDYWQSKKYKETEDKNEYIICVGYRKRDWNTLIQAYSKCNTNIKLYLVGNDKLEVNDNRIKLIPFVPVKKCMELVYNSLFCVLPLNEMNYSFGQMTLLQEMALGKVVVAADVSSVADYDSPGLLKYIPENVDDLYNVINHCLDLNENIHTLGLKNRNAIRKSYTEQIMAKEVEKICNEVCKQV